MHLEDVIDSPGYISKLDFDLDALLLEIGAEVRDLLVGDIWLHLPAALSELLFEPSIHRVLIGGNLAFRLRTLLRG